MITPPQIYYTGSFGSDLQQCSFQMAIATLEQITVGVASPTENRQRQQVTMRVQTQHLLARLDRRMQVAIDLQNCCLISQLQAEQEFLSRQL